VENHYEEINQNFQKLFLLWILLQLQKLGKNLWFQGMQLQPTELQMMRENVGREQ